MLKSVQREKHIIYSYTTSCNNFTLISMHDYVPKKIDRLFTWQIYGPKKIIWQKCVFILKTFHGAQLFFGNWCHKLNKLIVCIKTGCGHCF